MKSKTLVIILSLLVLVIAAVVIIMLVFALIDDSKSTKAGGSETPNPFESPQELHSSSSTDQAQPSPSLKQKENSTHDAPPHASDMRVFYYADSSVPYPFHLDECNPNMGLMPMALGEDACWIKLKNSLGTPGGEPECYPSNFLEFNYDFLKFGDLNGDGYDDAWGPIPINSPCTVSTHLYLVWIYNTDNPDRPFIANIGLSGALGRDSSYEFIDGKLRIMNGDCEVQSYQFRGSGQATIMQGFPEDGGVNNCANLGP